MEKEPESANKLALKILFVFLVIIGIFIGYTLLQLHDFMESEKARAKADMPTTRAVIPLKTEGWNDIDEDTKNYMRERDATRETRATEKTSPTRSLTQEEIDAEIEAVLRG